MWLTVGEGDPYTKDFPSMIDFFSSAVARMQGYSELRSADMMFDLGRKIGRAIGQKMKSSTLKELMEELPELWESLEIARLNVESKDPPRFTISECEVCGQVPGVTPFRCYFHEGVLQGILDERIGKGASIKQSDVFQGDAGTLCRAFEITAL